MSVVEKTIRGMPLSIVVDIREMEIVAVHTSKGRNASWFNLSAKEIADILEEA